jgi:hypothetical protein
MSFWKGLGSRSNADARPAQENALEEVKQFARENTARERRALEQQPRASAAANSERIKRLRTIDDVMNVYSKMRHADFCEVVAGAVKAGNFSDHDASFVMYAREWVRCGAAYRTSFPEWMEAEGRGHCLALNTKWLSSGVDPRTSFNDWLASESSVQSEVIEPPRSVSDKSRGWAGLDGVYERDNLPMLDGILETVYKNIYALRDSPELMAFYASSACGVAVTVRMIANVDMGTLVFPIETSPLPSSHPVMKVLPILDEAIEGTVKWLSTAPKDDPRMVDALTKMYACFMWKSYLLALNTQPAAWDKHAVCALSSFRMLTTADPVRVIKNLREDIHGLTKEVFTAGIRNSVKDADWPPRGYVDLYFKNHGLLERKCRALFGTYD